MIPVKIRDALRLCTALFLLCIGPGFVSFVAGAEVFRIGSYNVENLFDLSHDGTEYPGYVPGSKHGWGPEMLAIKAGNISRVITDLDAHILALQEIESMEALEYLRDVLIDKGLNYPYIAVTKKDETAVRCAILSKYPIVESTDIMVAGRNNRNILKATVEIDGKQLVLFVNHWRSRNAPESFRKISAKALYEAISALEPGTDYILLGDFNSNYNEFEIIKKEDRINDTKGRTGINHVLKTKYKGKLVNPEELLQYREKKLHYNLWREIEKDRRWSYLYFGRMRTIDAILLPAALYDDKGISYLDNSFDKFDPGYLFKNGDIFRWQREGRGRGRHLGKGYSDHLPIYACFTTTGFVPSRIQAPCYPEPVAISISNLYESKTGAVRYSIENAIVIYKYGNNAVIKQKGGRAIYIFGVAKGLELGKSYNLIVSRLNRYYGNMQVTGIENAVKNAGKTDVFGLLWTDTKIDLEDRSLENEVVSRLVGRYEDGWFSYGSDRSIRVYFRDKTLVPDRSGRVEIRNARIGLYRNPQIVIEQKSQIHSLQ